MIYHLLDFLASRYDFAGEGLIQYITVRSIVAVIISLLVSMFFGWKIINRLRRKQIGEEIRQLGLEGEKTKKGTPTMGGVIIILSILVPTLLFADLTNIYVQLLILTTVWLGAVGFIDDYIKVVKKNKEGLSGKYKIVGQVSLGLIVGTVLWFNDDVVIRIPDAEAESFHERAVHSDIEETVVQPLDHSGKTISYSDYKSTKTTIPFVKENEFDYRWLVPFEGQFAEWLSWVIYIFVIIFVITAVSNGTNLTDGIDGLATGTSAIVGATLAILAYVSGNIVYANYLDIMYIPFTGEVVIFLAAFTGALIGFLWYNSYPAQVFMGDTGSLMIGGIIAVAAIIIRKELLIPLLCGIFLVESLSVILQRFYFKYTKKKYGEGRRIFKMSPLHHHFQKEGIESLIKRPEHAIPEAKLVTRFWIVGILLAIITIITLKIR